ncbi:MAG: hypothetical protein ABJB12_16515 [Pseudomonadota bacterium]
MRLERALAQGAVLATLTVSGCAGKADGSSTPEGMAGGSSAAGEGGSLGGDGSAVGGGPAGGSGGEVLLSELPALPADAVQCTGPDYDGGYHGQCCGEVKCLPPQSGKCASAETAELGSYGSGACLCGDGKTGPYARGSACCYVVHSIGCEGRPLLVEGDAVVSPLGLKSDWLTRDLLELLAV